MNVYLLGALLVMVAVMSTPGDAAICALVGNACGEMNCCSDPAVKCVHNPSDGTSVCQNLCPVPPPVKRSIHELYVRAAQPAAICAQERDACDRIECCPGQGLTCIHTLSTGHNGCQKLSITCP